MTYIAAKSLRAVFSIAFIVTAVFLLMRLVGDPALAILGPDDFPPEILAEFRALWGLDQPLWQQYVEYVRHAVSGEFGRSFVDNRPALAIVLERLPSTLALMGAALAITLLIGVPAGIVSALRQNRLSDMALSGAAIVFQATPNFVLGVALILVFAVWLRLLPAAGAETWQHGVLPAVTFGASNAAIFARFVRATLLDVLRQPYMLAASARGLSPTILLLRHALPNAGLPLLTVLGFSLGGMVAGSIIVETIFAWPGVGRLTATSVAFRDLAVIQVIALLTMTAMVTTNLAVDLLYAVLDPRIRLSRTAR